MIDFHCHLDLYRYPSIAIEDADEANIHVLFVTTTPKAWPKAQTMVTGRHRIRVALGLHPQIAHERKSELELFELFGNQTKFFGEIGLDGAPQLRKFHKTQKEIFNYALRIASNMGGKILSIHSRRAAEEVLNSLSNYPDSGIPVLHWFSGSHHQLHQAIEQNCWFSCGPAMLRTAKGKEIVKKIPHERILTETDGPFACVGSRPLQPADSWLAVDILCEIWEKDHQDVVAILQNNLENLSSRVHLHPSSSI